MSPIRIIISDADRTLLSNGRLFYPRDFELMLEECRALGIPFVIASGRTLGSLERIFSNFIDRLIFFSFDGAHISAGRVRIADFPIARASLDHAIRLADSGEVSGVELCTAERSYLISKNTMLHEYEKKRLGSEYSAFDKLPDRIYKLIVFNRCGADIDIPGLHPVYKSDRVIEFVREDVDKARAARLLCNELGIASEDVAAFGDSENDRTLLEFSGYPVTIYGSRHDIFALSSHHTSNVAGYVRHLIRSASTKGNTF